MNPPYLLVIQREDGSWMWRVEGVADSYEQAMRLGTAAAELAKLAVKA